MRNQITITQETPPLNPRKLSLETRYTIPWTLPARQQALSAAIGVASTYIPGVNIPLGDNFAIGISPALFLGVGGLGLGANVNASYSSKYVDVGVGLGATAWTKHLFSGQNFLEGRLSGQVAVGGSNFKAGLATSYFSGGGIGQQTGSLVAYGNDWGLRYENDFMWGMPISDGGDRWRTTGVNINYKDFSMGMHFATGDPDAKYGDVKRPETAGNYNSRYGSSPNAYRLGSLTLGYKSTFAGWNSERIRHIGQNRFAHDIIQRGNAKHFRMLPNAPNQGFYHGFRRPNLFTTW